MSDLMDKVGNKEIKLKLTLVTSLEAILTMNLLLRKKTTGLMAVLQWVEQLFNIVDRTQPLLALGENC